jgi:hypothetical protein
MYEIKNDPETFQKVKMYYQAYKHKSNLNNLDIFYETQAIKEYIKENKLEETNRQVEFWICRYEESFFNYIVMTKILAKDLYRINPETIDYEDFCDCINVCA